MRNKTKKLISIVLTSVLTLTCLYSSFSALADDLIPINSTYFPNTAWRTIVSEYYDTNGDDYLSAEERNVTLMSITGMADTLFDGETAVTDITGIEYFSSVKTLRCGGIGLETLDVSKMTNLVNLSCQGNNLKTLVVRNNVLLEELNCSDNALSVLSLTYNVNLQRLLCSENMITSLDTSNLGKLTYLKCSNNEINSLNLTGNSLLETIICSNNHMQSLNLASNKALVDVTANNIGAQTISASATVSNSVFNVGIPLDSAKIVSTNADSYENNAFLTSSYDVVKNGVTYDYDTGLDSAEPMDVSVTCEKNFFIVNYYTNDTKSMLLKTEYVMKNESSTPPTQLEPPQCKVFDSWSVSTANITADTDAYIIWADAHAGEAITAFSNGEITLSCTGCGVSRTVNYIDYVNAKSGDQRYISALDVNSDGYINARDYAQLAKTF